MPHRVEYILEGRRSCKNLLHMNDYVMERACVYGVIALSKWPGLDRFPRGIYGMWPPDPPPEAVPAPAAADVLAIADDEGAG